MEVYRLDINSWNKWYNKEIKKSYFEKILFEIQRKERQRIIYPQKSDRLRAFEITNFSDLKVIFIATQPYHTPNTADGLALSSMYTMTPELINLYRKIEDDLKIKCDSQNPSLERWAKQGVLLLNLYMTIDAGRPTGVHDDLNWWKFTTNVIEYLYSDDSPKVFVLMGVQPRKLKYCLENRFNINHLIIETELPSSRFFFSEKHFQRINEYLLKYYDIAIDWS